MKNLIIVLAVLLLAGTAMAEPTLRQRADKCVGRLCRVQWSIGEVDPNVAVVKAEFIRLPDDPNNFAVSDANEGWVDFYVVEGLNVIEVLLTFSNVDPNHCDDPRMERAEIIGKPEVYVPFGIVDK